MKIPQINYDTPVAPLAKLDVSAPGREAAANQRIIGQVAELGAKIYTDVQIQQGLDTYAQSVAEMNALEVEMKNRPASDPKGLETEFNTSMDRIAREPEKNLSGTSLTVWRERFKAKRQAQWFGTSNLNASRLWDSQRKSTQDTVNKTAEVDLPAALEIIDGATVFNDFEKTVMRDGVKKISVQSEVQQAEQSGDVDAIEAQLAVLQTEDSPLSETERHRSIGYLKAARKEAIAKDLADLARARDLTLSELEIDIDKGVKGAADVDNAWDNGIIKTSAKRTELLRRIEKGREDSIEGARLSAMLSKSLLSGEPMDPRDKDNIKAVDNRYNAALKRLAGANLSMPQRAVLQEELTRKGMALAKMTNILPKKMLGDLRRYAFAGSEASAAKQATIYEKLQDIAPQSLDKLSTDEESVYVMAAAMISGGMSPPEAVVQARENVKQPPEVKAGFARAYKAEGYGGDRLAEAYTDEDRFDIEVFGEATPTPAQMGVYSELERQFYLNNGGDIELAKTAAINKFKRIYSGSTAATSDHSQRVMPFSPERYYGMTPSSVQKDLRLFAKEKGLKTPKKVFISSDPETMRATDKTYPVWELNAFGLPQRPLDDKGIPLRWKPSRVRENLKTEARRKDRLQRFNPGDRQDLIREEKRISKPLKFTPIFSGAN